jgi:hypothetical protein
MSGAQSQLFAAWGRKENARSLAGERALVNTKGTNDVTNMNGGAAKSKAPTSAGNAGAAWLEANLKRARVVGRFAEFFDIDVERAVALLERNTSNRAIITTGVRDWAETLRRGDWAVNGEPVIVSETGELNDGQHRLTAVVETGITLHTLVVFGVSRESRKTVDTGRKRTAGHVLGMAGIAQASLIAAALKVIINLDTGASVNAHRTAQEIERAFILYDSVEASLSSGTRVARQFRQSTGMCCALHYIMAQKSREQANQFFEMLADGTAPAKTHAVAQLRARLIENLSGKAKLPIIEVAAIFIKAWNAYRIGKPVSSLRWRTEGNQPEAFPRIA